MNRVVTGTIELQDFGPGVWTLVTDSGERYQLADADEGLLRPGLRAEVEGHEPPGGGVGIGMTGRILRVVSYCVVDAP